MTRTIIARALRLSSINRPIASQQFQCQCPSYYAKRMASSNSTLQSDTISEVTAREKELTGLDQPRKGGPTAQAQKHAGEPLSGDAISAIHRGEKNVTFEDAPVPGGPTAFAQSAASSSTVSFHRAFIHERPTPNILNLSCHVLTLRPS